MSSRDDTNEDVFVHQSAIAKNNPNKYKKSVGENERVEFDIIQGGQLCLVLNTQAADCSNVLLFQR